MTERVVSFIDGFNLYFGMKEAGLKSCLWLDPVRLSSALCSSNQVLRAANYFTARISGPREKQRRQKLLLEAYETLADCQLYFGKYQDQIVFCHRCKQGRSVHSEKMTDVNIAVQMLAGAFNNDYDCALLISADSDIVPAVQMVRTLFSKRVVVAFPPKRVSEALKRHASGYTFIPQAKLSQSQLPDSITKRDGFVIHRPPTWA